MKWFLPEEKACGGFYFPTTAMVMVPALCAPSKPPSSSRARVFSSSSLYLGVYADASENKRWQKWHCVTLRPYHERQCILLGAPVSPCLSGSLSVREDAFETLNHLLGNPAPLCCRDHMERPLMAKELSLGMSLTQAPPMQAKKLLRLLPHSNCLALISWKTLSRNVTTKLLLNF